MTTTLPKPSKALHIIAWFAQIVLAFNLAWASYMKLIAPVSEVAAMWPWAGEVSLTFLRFTGIVDLLGAIGLIVPAATRIKPILTPIAALGVIALMICAIVFHISRGEATQIGFNIFVIVVAGFVAWVRFKYVL